MPGSTFRRSDRLPEKDFGPAVHRTTPVRTANLRIHARPNGLARSRLGVSVGRRFGNAAVRNRLKRLTREAFRTSGEVRAAGLDIVVVATDARVLERPGEIGRALRLVVERA